MTATPMTLMTLTTPIFAETIQIGGGVLLLFLIIPLILFWRR